VEKVGGYTCVTLAVGSWSDGSSHGTCAGVSRRADAGLKIDRCSKTRVVL